MILPAVTALLLVGAMFVALAWDSARDAVDSAAEVDANRADRNAVAVSDLLMNRERLLATWIDERNIKLDQAAGTAAARSGLEQLASSISVPDAVAHAVVLPDGALLATAEAEPGTIATSGVGDDLSAFGRQVVARNDRRVSGRFSAGDRRLFAIGVPIPAARDGDSPSGALVAAYDVDSGPLGSFFPTQSNSAADGLALRDERGRIIAGTEVDDGGEPVVRRVEGTEWRLILSRAERPNTLLPEWTYPMFAGLLFLLAIGYTGQEVTRRRYQQIGSERSQQLRSLFDLSSAMLHSSDQREQAEHLAEGVLQLVGASGVTVAIADHLRSAPVLVGRIAPHFRSYRVAITGSHGPLGEVVVHRAGRPFDGEERSVVQTAAALAGAALHTSATIETERAAAAELQRLDELRSNLLATVAHELRSPVTAVKGVLGLLSMQEDLSERTRTYVSVAIERTDRLVALIQDLFDCSLLETGQLDIRPQRQLASELLESALGAQAAARPGELRLDATENLAITVDPVRFDQLVNNLVTNAFRHGEPPVEVTVRPTTDGVVIVVADEGPGIAPEDRDRIFGKFWQGSTGHARLVEGAGLGLSLVQGLVALHGGRIEIDSAHADGRGARFTIWLPDVVPGV